jgi:hypothetical protein
MYMPPFSLDVVDINGILGDLKGEVSMIHAMVLINWMDIKACYGNMQPNKRHMI